METYFAKMPSSSQLLPPSSTTKAVHAHRYRQSGAYAP
jgi:hypothetical protein